jgi:hypothetical protein
MFLTEMDGQMQERRVLETGPVRSHQDRSVVHAGTWQAARPRDFIVCAVTAPGYVLGWATTVEAMKTAEQLRLRALADVQACRGFRSATRLPKRQTRTCYARYRLLKPCCPRVR